MKTLGSLYSPNAGVFRDLYADLRRYYRGTSLNLEEALDEFWMRLLERLLKAHDPSLVSDDFLECASKQTETLRPFGDAPRELRVRLVRVLVAARAFVQGLNVAGEVVRKVSQVWWSDFSIDNNSANILCVHLAYIFSLLSQETINTT